jgi:putative hemolysin
MKIITTEELASVTKLDKLKMPGLASFLMEFMKLNEINQVFSNSMHIDGLPFIDSILDQLNVSVEISEAELANIPTKGPFIAVANHPFGGIEGLILLKVICKVRPEFKVMANFLLNKIPNLKEFFIPVNPFEKVSSVSSVGGMKQAMESLRSGVPMGIFPAGEVSTYRTSVQRVTDKKWSPIVGKMIQKTEYPVLPVYFHGNNGLLFNILSFIHPSLRTAKLPSEFLNKKGHTIQIRIGKPVRPEEYKPYHNPEHLLNFIRAKTYALGTGIEVKSFFKRKNPFKFNKVPQAIVPAQAKSVLEKEVASLRSEYLMTTEKNYEVFVCPINKIPHIIREIGRLREITFREVGEGTQKKIDLDEFDLYYNHLFIWDRDENQIVGSYRLGKGKDIFYSYGLKGFYLSTLFKIRKDFFPIMKESIELGRSFIRKEYQNRPLSLFLLWKGILYFLLKNPEYRYLIGPVSISNNFSKFSSSLLVDFLMKNHFDQTLSEMVSPRKKFRINFDNLDPSLLLKDSDNIKSLDSLISEIEINHNKVPVLLRQYIAINSKLIGFNVDPKFANCLDGFLIVDIHEIPEEKVRMLSKELNPPEEAAIKAD